MREINRIILHHSASDIRTTAADIRRWHIARGWDDIGYHYVVEIGGRVVEGRELDVVGAHALGSNRDSIGVCVTGDYTERALGRGRRHALVRLCARLCERFALDASAILGHNEVADTLCPGYDPEDIRNAVALRLQGVRDGA